MVSGVHWLNDLSLTDLNEKEKGVIGKTEIDDSGEGWLLGIWWNVWTGQIRR